MKSRQLYPSLAVIIAGSIMFSCSSMNSLTIPVIEPAPVYLPSSVQSVGIINRSLPSDQNKQMDDIDKFLSVEGKNFDIDGANASVQGLFDELKKNERFAELKIIEVENLKNPGMGVFPAPLTWSQVSQICEQQEVDALFALSFYDTDAKVNYNANPVKINTPLGVSLPMVETEVTIRTLVKSGWRVYDPSNEIIQDEFLLNSEQVSSGRGINPMNAAQAIIGRKEAVMQISNRLGQDYALRILPYRHRVNREYYVKGTDNFEVGKRRAQTGNWDGAAELWEKETTNSKAKIAGQAYYNMAIINEINGNLEEAIDWASKAYSDYSNKPALDYVRILKNRLYRDQQLRSE